jgi:hypothetical protein
MCLWKPLSAELETRVRSRQSSPTLPHEPRLAIGSFHRWFHLDPETTQPRRVSRPLSRKADWVQDSSTRRRINLMRGESTSNSDGTRVSITHATVTSRFPEAAWSRKAHRPAEMPFLYGFYIRIAFDNTIRYFNRL